MEEPHTTANEQFDPHEFANAGTIAKWLDGVPDEQKLPYEPPLQPYYTM
jgi:hypothetical protein